MRARTERANAVRPVKARISETLVLPAPAVASAGRGVLVTRDRAERPVHAQTFSGAPLTDFRTPNDCVCADDEKANCILCRKLARNQECQRCETLVKTPLTDSQLLKRLDHQPIAVIQETFAIRRHYRRRDLPCRANGADLPGVGTLEREEVVRVPDARS